MVIYNPYSQYLENQLTTATPGKLLVMTYDAAIRFARTAAEKMSENKLDEQSANIKKVQNIILELMSSLDPNVDRQLAANLSSIYNFIFDGLTQANIKDDIKLLNRIINMLVELRDTWAEAELLIRSGGSPKVALEARVA